MFTPALNQAEVTSTLMNTLRRLLISLDCLSPPQGRRWKRQIDTNQKRPWKTPEAEVLWCKFQGWQVFSRTPDRLWQRRRRKATSERDPVARVECCREWVGEPGIQGKRAAQEKEEKSQTEEPRGAGRTRVSAACQRTQSRGVNGKWSDVKY